MQSALYRPNRCLKPKEIALHESLHKIGLDRLWVYDDAILKPKVPKVTNGNHRKEHNEGEQKKLSPLTHLGWFIYIFKGFPMFRKLEN